MKTRVILLLPLAVLTACGSSVVPSADQAHTMACRGYVLAVGNGDTKHVKELIAESPYSTDQEQSDTVLAKMRTAAVSSGATAGLSDGDFQRFRKIVEGIDGLVDQAVSLNDGSMEVPTTALQAVVDASAAVHEVCY